MTHNKTKKSMNNNINDHECEMVSIKMERLLIKYNVFIESHCISLMARAKHFFLKGARNLNKFNFFPALLQNEPNEMRERER